MTSSPRRVVITGVGFVSPLGSTRKQLWEALTSGTSGVRTLVRMPGEHLPTAFGGEAVDFEGGIEGFGPLEKTKKRAIKKGLRVMCREIQMGVAAAQLALDDAGWNEASPDPDRSGVVYGTDYIMTRPEEFESGVRECTNEAAFHFEQWGSTGLPKVQPLWLLKYLPNMPASHIAIYNDFRGPNNSLTLREASPNAAVGEAFHTISRGSADVIIAGATGTRIHPLRSVHAVLQEQIATGDDPSKLSRPFDKQRNGMVLGEGAGALILEDYEMAVARGANILAEVKAQASSIAVQNNGVANYGQAVRNVLSTLADRGSLTPSQLGHIHAHGLSTHLADEEEAGAISSVFGTQVPVTAAKSYFGNLGAASGMIEIIASILALQEGQLFPILNYEDPDPSCPIRAATAGEPAGDSFMNVNFTPQGQASAVLIQQTA